MEITNSVQAREFINAWKNQPSKQRYINHITWAIDSMNLCASLTRKNCPNTRKDYENAAETLQNALTEY